MLINNIVESETKHNHNLSHVIKSLYSSKLSSSNDLDIFPNFLTFPSFSWINFEGYSSLKEWFPTNLAQTYYFKIKVFILLKFSCTGKFVLQLVTFSCYDIYC